MLLIVRIGILVDGCLSDSDGWRRKVVTRVDVVGWRGALTLGAGWERGQLVKSSFVGAIRMGKVVIWVVVVVFVVVVVIRRV